MNSSELDLSERVGVAIRDARADVVAPQSLRANVAAARLSRRRRSPLRLRWAGAAAVLAAAAVAVAIVLPGAEDRADAHDVAALSLSRPALPAPKQDGRFLDAAVGSVRFPDYHYVLRLDATGAREDRLGDHRAATVRYSNGRTDVGYTIVDSWMGAPTGARWVTYRGVRAAVFRDHGALVVLWKRAGKTCVLASRGASEQMLLRMASWT